MRRTAEGEGAPHLGGRGGAFQRAAPSAWRRAGAPSERRSPLLSPPFLKPCILFFDQKACGL